MFPRLRVFFCFVANKGASRHYVLAIFQSRTSLYAPSILLRQLCLSTPFFATKHFWAEAGILSLRGLIALGSCMSLYTSLAQQSQLCQSAHFHAPKRVYVGIVVHVDTTCLQSFSHVHLCTLLQYCFACCVYLRLSLPRNIFWRRQDILSLRGLIALGSCMSLYTILAQQAQLSQSTYFHTLKRV